ncbi:uncharacterized protein [Henckelia pumila]|uniref:uncharacterized protein n=1 Tax=Henckelia pumila TaxID=405737 RepID=UPI003C6DC0F6
MICVVWNARGLGNERASHELQRLIAKKSMSFIFLCETKLRDFSCKRWKDVLGFFGLFVVNYEGRSGGLILLWKKILNVTINYFTAGNIDSTMQHGEKIWRFTGFYETFGGNPRPLSQTRAFREVLNASSLHDLHVEGEVFTWVNRRASPNVIFEGIDRYVATFEWRLLYPAERVQTLEFYHSDHRPILLELGGPQQIRARNLPSL